MRTLISLVVLLFITLWSKAQISEVDTAPITLGAEIVFDSEILGESRRLNVYLPPDYNPDSLDRYPVIYLLDGGTDEDFIHIAGLTQFATFPWIEMMPPSILVGIVNVDRKKDFTFPSSVARDNEEFPTTGHSAPFIDCIADEIQPLIEKRYRCSAKEMIIGQSLGGLLATEILYTHPSLFDQYLIVSPSMWWDDRSLLDKELNFSHEVQIFLAVGNEGEEMVQGARDLNSRLVDAASDGNQIDFLYFEDNDHGNILHLAAYYGLQSFYPKAKD